nr:YfjP family GTPase [Motilibacter deserti]
MLATRRRTRELPERLSALDAVVTAAEGRVRPELVDAARGVLEQAGQRMRLSPGSTVVALAGGTGSGKSSLFNALSGSALSTVGVRRPTTSDTHACVWPPADAGPLLDWLGVARRHVVPEAEADPALHGLVLLDLPDYDSTEARHRREAERLVGMVDILVWVVDPQKYADAALHERYLSRLRAHRAVTLLVLNQADLLTPDAVEACVADLHRLLKADGLGAAPVLALSARTGAGLPELRGVLSAAVAKRAAATERLSADVDAVVDRLAGELAEPADGQALGTVGRKERARLREALALAAGVPVIEDAVRRASLARTVAATGWPFTRWIGRLRRDPLRRLHLEAPAGRSSLPPPSPVARAGVYGAVRGVVDAASHGLPEPWARAVASAAQSSEADLDDALDSAVTSADLPDTRRVRLWERGVRLLQLALAAVALAGVAWLCALFVVAWAQLPDPPTPDVGPLALPTVLLLGGALLGLAVAGLSRVVGRAAARRAARRVGAELRRRVDDVADAHVLEPVKDELQRYVAAREALRRAG